MQQLLKRSTLITKSRLGALALNLAVLLLANPALAQLSGSVTMFGKVGGTEALNDSIITQVDEQEFLSADILVSANYNRFNLLAEFVADDGEEAIERLQIGYRFTDSSQLWIGKFHNPAEYWIHEYHRGYYLQPSITVPFESFAGYQGGATSKNLSGIRLDSEFLLGNDKHQIQTFITLADTPEVSASKERVDADDLLSIDFDEGKLLTSIKLAYKPDPLSESALGFTYTQATAGTNDDEVLNGIPVFGSLLVGLELDVTHVNGYLNLENDRGRLLYSDSNMKIDLMPPAATVDLISASFGSTNFDQHIRFRYLHGEYYLNNRWSVFGRYEKVDSQDTTASVDMILDSLGIESKYTKRIMGLRFDPISNHALSLQYSNHSTRAGKENNLHLNWTFVLDWGF